MGRRLALLIATYEYQDTDLRQLTAPAHDAEAFAAVLGDPAIAGFEVTTLVNEPHHRVGEAIGEFYRNRRMDDLTLLYFTGHGLKDEEGRLFLAMTNTRRDSLLFTGLSAEHVDRAMEGCVSRQKVLMLDCCYSGAFPPGRIAKADTAVHSVERFQGSGRTVLTASDAVQYSFEGGQLHGEAAQSVFTRHVVAGLRDGSADLDGDGDITLDELYSYVHDRVVEEIPQQRPKKQDNVEGRTVIAKNINWTLPDHLRHAIDSPFANDRRGALDRLVHLHRIGNDTVRSQVREQIRRLTDDDSKRVSAAAATCLNGMKGAAENPVPPPIIRLAALGVRGHHLEVWALNTEGRISHSWWPRDGGSEIWNKPYDFHAPSGIVDLAAASRGPEHGEVFAVDDHGTLWHRWWWPYSWSEWHQFDGRVMPPLAACSYTDGHIEIFAHDPTEDSVIHAYSWEAGKWSGWIPLDEGIEPP